ncbi:hypothetical protein FRC18_003369 [Serendipita sp. 400]|nr:hypothetical protein FRC18_003369 [Serendipita sp. 400]
MSKGQKLDYLSFLVLHLYRWTPWRFRATWVKEAGGSKFYKQTKHLFDSNYIHLAMSYVIMGRRVASEYLTLGTLATLGGVIALSRAGGSKSKPQAAKENLSLSGSTEEDDFIKNFVAEAEKEGAKKK